MRRALIRPVKAPPGSKTFDHTGAEQTWTVPDGVTTVTIDASGAQGGGAGASYSRGGRAIGTITVTPGQVLYVNVGGQPTGIVGGFNGGGAAGGAEAFGAGGASDVRTASGSLASRLIVAGGGGGCVFGGNFSGGHGGAATGASGSGTGGGGVGGGQAAGGTAGGAGATAGAQGVGGTGSTFYTYDGGGGGGGFYGGGGGGAHTAYGGGGGGGGGSNGPTAALTVNTQGYRAGHGQIIISW